MLSSPRTTNTLARSEHSATFGDDAFRDSISEVDDKENVRHNGPRGTRSGAGGVADDAFSGASRDAELKQQQVHCDRFSQQMTQSMSGETLLDLAASLSDCSDGDDGDGGNADCTNKSNRCSVSEWERRGILRMSELSLSGMSQSGRMDVLVGYESFVMQPAIYSQVAVALFRVSVCTDLEPFRSRQMTRSEMDKSIGEMTRRALDWMQQDTEKQAKENKAMQELLRGVISIINGAIADLAPPSRDRRSGVRFAASAYRHIPEVQHWKELSIAKVDKLVSEWETVLLNWRKDALDSKKEAREGFELFREDCEAKDRQLCELHALERGKTAVYRAWVSWHCSTELIEPCFVLLAALEEKILDLIALTDQQQMLCGDSASGIWSAATRSTAATDLVDRQEGVPSWTRLGGGLNDKQLFCDRETMNFTAQLKEAELCSLQWQMAYENQVSSSRQMQERLGMLLEEAADSQLELQEQKRRLSRMIRVDALKVYQQKIALLEDQVHDTQQQVACDHEQFLYERRKWECEKKRLSKEVQEIQDVSVKVLKMLLIREKMLKKQERHFQKRSLGFEDQQNLLTDQFNALQAISEELMQECALILVALQEQTICSRDRSSHHHPTGQNQIPVKPLQIKRMIKRLRKVQRVLETQRLSGTTEPQVPPGEQQCSFRDFGTSRLGDQSL